MNQDHLPGNTPRSFKCLSTKYRYCNQFVSVIKTQCLLGGTI